MTDRMAVVTDEEPLKRGHNVPLTKQIRKYPRFQPMNGQARFSLGTRMTCREPRSGHQDDDVFDGQEPDDDNSMTTTDR
jgi:hypothetical protein